MLAKGIGGRDVVSSEFYPRKNRPMPRALLTKNNSSAQEWTNHALDVHERTSAHFLVLQGSLLSITEITEYRYFSPLKPIRELIYKSE